uniref:Flg_bbr_C domain-containing protein n=1 Tax=Angiostrongylus cantonensis TaxID=6313 RepID=A0A0K0DGR3_ANGCA
MVYILGGMVDMPSMANITDLNTPAVLDNAPQINEGAMNIDMRMMMHEAERKSNVMMVRTVIQLSKMDVNRIMRHSH